MLSRPATQTRISVLILTSYFFPGYKAGGPISSLYNIVQRLGAEISFKVITQDRDHGDMQPYCGIAVNEWQKVGQADVLYLAPEKLSLRTLVKLLCSTKYDVLYLNSFFSPTFTIKPLFLRWLHLVPRIPLVIAPRGEFSHGALSIGLFKKLKKKIYIYVSKFFGFLHDALWQASSTYEEEDIRYWFGKNISVVIAPNLPSVPPFSAGNILSKNKSAGSMRIVFLSRITRMKNLRGALNLLKGLSGKVHFTIYGIIEDRDYWAECQSIIAKLPENIKVSYKGAVAHGDVMPTLRDHDFFFLPTLGENFGHAIVEALQAGCPVLISDRTPWRNLAEKGIGWDIPLEQEEYIRSILQHCIDMDADTYQMLSRKAQAYGFEISQCEEAIKMNKNLFYRAMMQNGEQCAA